MLTRDLGLVLISSSLVLGGCDGPSADDEKDEQAGASGGATGVGARPFIGRGGGFFGPVMGSGRGGQGGVAAPASASARGGFGGTGQAAAAGG